MKVGSWRRPSSDGLRQQFQPTSAGNSAQTSANSNGGGNWTDNGSDTSRFRQSLTSVLGAGGIWTTTGSLSLGGTDTSNATFSGNAAFRAASVLTNLKSSDKGSGKDSGDGSSNGHFSELFALSAANGWQLTGGATGASSNGSSQSSSSSSGTSDDTSAAGSNQGSSSDNAAGGSTYTKTTGATAGSDGVWISSGSLTQTAWSRALTNYHDDSSHQVPAYSGGNAGTMTSIGSGQDNQTYNLTETQNLVNGAWVAVSGTQTTTDNGLSDMSTSGSGSYTIAVGTGSMTDTWSESGTDDSTYSSSTTQVIVNGAWVTQSSTSSDTDTVSESMSDSFSGSVPVAGGSGGNSAMSGSGAYTLEENVSTQNGGTPTITSANVNGSGAWSQDGTDAGFSVQVSDTAGNLTTGISENNTDSLSGLSVDLTPGSDWLESFSGQVVSGAAGALATSSGGSGSSSGGSTGSSEGPSVGGVTRTIVDNSAGELLSETVTDNATGNILYSESCTYDPSGNMLTQTDGDRRTTAWTYNAAGQVTSETIAYGTPQAATTYYGYDESGNLISVIDPDGNETLYTYNAQGEETSMTDPLGHTETMTYNDQGLLASVTNRNGLTTDYTYNAAGQVTGETWYAADGVTVTNQLFFTYNADGTLASAGNDNGIYTFTYNKQGQVIGVTEPFGVSLSFGYDADGNRVVVQDSFGGTTESTYDAADQLVSELFTQQGERTMRIDQTYNADGEVATQTRYSDAAGQNVVATSDYTYDFNGNETQIIHKTATGAVLAEYDYTHDPAGDLVSETDNGVTTKYQYDATGQLVGYGSTTQSYDANGNRNGSDYIVGPDNQLLSDGTWNYTYDGEGNEASKTNIATGVTWTYGYDNKNELVSAVEKAADGTVEVEADYKYDVFGNRIEKDVYTPAAGTVVTKYAWDAWNPNTPSGVGNENWNVWADLDANNNLVTRYFRGDALDQIFAQIGAGASVAWYLTDNLGSTRVLVDGSGNVLDEINYGAFGDVTSQTNPAEQPRYLYTGREWDVETDLQYNRARYYDPATGRWIGQDPTGFNAGDSNLYRYGANKPTEGTDPSGDSYITRQTLPDGTEHLYYHHTMWGWTVATFGIGGLFARGADTYIGRYDPATGVVTRGNRNVGYEAVRGAAEGTFGGMPNWDHFFRENDQELNPAFIGQGQLWREAMGEDFRNNATVAKGQIHEVLREAAFAFVGALTGSRVRISGTAGVAHSFDSHAAQWFGRAVTRQRDLAAWEQLLERAARSRAWFTWSSGGTPSYATLMRFQGKWLLVQVYREGPMAGQLLTAFVPNQTQLRRALRLLASGR